MSMKKIKYILISIVAFVLSTMTVHAGANYSVSGDMITISYSGPSATAIYWNKSNSFSTAQNIKGVGAFSNGVGYLSVKNGTYYFFGKNTSGGTMQSGAVKVTTSCNNEKKVNQSGTFTVEKCYIAKQGSTQPYADDATTFSCAKGYYPDQSKTTIKRNECNNLKFTNGVKQRYCKVVFQATCSKSSSGGSGGGGGSTKVAAAKLSSLSVSSGKMSPGFKASTKSYKVTVDSSVSSIKINATAASGGTLVSGYGTRTEKLKFGSNTFYVKVKNSKGAVTSYKIVVNRPDSRNTTNTLESLTITDVELSPEFNSQITSYTATVANDVESVTLNATLTDSKSTFAAGFGPNTYILETGTNNIYVKVKSEKGEVNVYNITIIKDELPTKCTTETERLALLKSVNFSVDTAGVEIDQIENFDPEKKNYSDLKVPYQVVNLMVNAATETDGDKFDVSGNENLQVNVPQEITVTVTSKECPNVKTVYTFNVTRQEESTASEESYLDDMKIKNHDEFEFKPEVNDYQIKLNKDEKQLEFEFKPVAGATCEVFDNDNLQLGSEIKIVCTAEDKEHTTEYTITVDGVKKGANGFLVILLIIIIIIILVYLIMRLLGYKVVLNLSVIGAFFRGIGEKVTNIFDK